MSRHVMTVLGSVASSEIGITDAHSHLWIEEVAGAAPDAPRLDKFTPISAELRAFHAAGGSAVIDCQPGGCGRNGSRLAELASASGIHIVACTGFHRRRYYAPDEPLWQLSANEACAHFVDEIHNGLKETRKDGAIVFPGFIKIAAEATLAGTPPALLAGAAEAAVHTGFAMEIHTERGAAVSELLAYFVKAGVDPHRLVFCHVDKRPDVGLHSELAAAGVMLEYDTFFRPKYEPERTVWPLLAAMVECGWGHRLALATDMAESKMWQQLGGRPGMAAFITEIGGRLRQMDFDEDLVLQLQGGNIVRRLAIHL